jgi:ABC-type branched-subunit amino acid transport system permease subunit
VISRAATAAAGPVPRGRRGPTLLWHLGGALVLVLLVMFATGYLTTFQDYQLALIAAYLCAVAGLTVLTGLSGQVSLGQGALLAVGAYTTAKMQAQFTSHNVSSQWTLLASLAVAVLVTCVVGLIIGLAAARLRGPYLAGLTLAIVVAVPAVATRYSGAFGGDQGLPVPVAPPPGGYPNEQWQAYLATIAAAITLFFLANLVRGRFGRTMRAVRDDDVAAQLAGVKVGRTRVVAFVVSAACAGLGGGMFAAINQAVSPDSFSLTLSLYLLLAIVLGGLGSLIGAVWGAAAIVILPYLTTQATQQLNFGPALAVKLKDNLPLAIFGTALVVIAIAAPGGVQGLLRRLAMPLRRRLLRRGGSTTPPPGTPGGGSSNDTSAGGPAPSGDTAAQPAPPHYPQTTG